MDNKVIGGGSAKKGLTEKVVKRLNEEKLRQFRPAVADDTVSSIVPPANVSTEGLFSLGQLNRKRIIHPRMDDKDVLNSFRFIRRKVMEKSPAQNGSTILVTPAADAGGGSFTAINLATVMAFERGIGSIIVDCNPVNADLSELLEVKVNKGWLDYVENPSLAPAEFIYKTGIRDVELMPAGGKKSMPAELMGISHMRPLFEKLIRESGRFIILDGPSLDNSEDPRMYADIADCVVIVVPYGRVTSDKLRVALRGVDSSKIAGAVINRSPAV